MAEPRIATIRMLPTRGVALVLAAWALLTAPAAAAAVGASEITGQVRANDGTPIAGAEVWSEAAAAWPAVTVGRPPRHPVLSDTEGRFRLPGGEDGRAVNLFAHADGFGNAVLPGVEAPAEDLVLTLPAGATIAGEVVDSAGRPIAGALIQVLPNPDETALQALGERSLEVRSDETGRFRLPSLDAGTYGLWLPEGGRNEVETVEVAAGETRDDIRLTVLPAAEPEPQPGPQEASPPPAVVSEVSGRVTGEDGSAVAGAVLSLTPDHTLSPRDRSHYDGTSDDDGRFILAGVPPGTYHLQTRHDAWVESEPQRLEVGEAPLRGVDVVLDRGAVIAGSITGLDAGELAGVTIKGWCSRCRISANAEGHPDPEGRFRFPAAAPGTWQISATTATGDRSISRDVEVVEADREVAVVLDFAAGFALTGELRINGEPRPGVPLMLSGASTLAQAVSDYLGRFRFASLPAGDYKLVILAPPSVQPVTLSGDRDLVVDIPVGVAAGRVVDADGQPVNAFVEMTGTGPDGIRVGGSGGTRGEPTFRFEAAAGDYRLEVPHTIHGSETVNDLLVTLEAEAPR